MVLALSDEDAATVDKFLDREGFTVRTASGSRSKGGYGVSGIPASFLIGADGTLLWKGHPTHLTREKLRALLGVTSTVPAQNFLALPVAPGARMHANLKPAAEAAEAGDLGRALELARSVSAEATESAAARAAADVLVGAIEAHVALLEAQAADYWERLEPLPARTLLEGLSTAFAEGEPSASREPGKRARARLEQLAADEAWTAELAGALALEAAVEASIGKDRAGSRKALRGVPEEHPGTLAARRAKRRMKRK